MKLADGQTAGIEKKLSRFEARRFQRDAGGSRNDDGDAAEVAFQLIAIIECPEVVESFGKSIERIHQDGVPVIRIGEQQSAGGGM